MWSGGFSSGLPTEFFFMDLDYFGLGGGENGALGEVGFS